jgi:hypothetical protein
MAPPVHIHVNDKLAPSAHQKLLQHVLTREVLKRIGQKEHNKKDNAIVQKCNEVWKEAMHEKGIPVDSVETA